MSRIHIYMLAITALARRPALRVAAATGIAAFFVSSFLRLHFSSSSLASRKKIEGKKIKLIYLDIPGYGEAIRLALHTSAILFEDVRVSYADVKRMRESGYLPFGQVPALEVDGVVYAQSAAILRWIGRQAGIYPDDLQIIIDQVEETLVDMRHVVLPGFYGAALGRSPVTGEPLLPLDDAQKAAALHALNYVILPARLKQLEVRSRAIP